MMFGFIMCACRWLAIGSVLLLSLVLLDFLRLPRSRFYTWTELLKVFAIRRMLKIMANIYWWRKNGGGYGNIQEANEQFVLSMVAKHASSDYGRDHNFSQIRSLEDFRRTQPVTDYEHYRKYIDIVMKGRVSAMYDPGEEVTCFCCSSGTTGDSKYIPTTAGVVHHTVSAIISAMNNFIGPYFIPQNMRKTMSLPSAPRWRYTESGVKIGPVSGHNMAHPLFATVYSTPFKGNIIQKEAEAMHVGLVLAMRDRDIHFWDAGFVFGLHMQLQFLESNWRSIVQDVRSGRLSDSVKVDDSQRKIINSLLIPDPVRAAELEHELQKGMDGIVPRLFPNMVGVSALSSGSSMSQYREKVSRYLGDLTIVSSAYAASEGILGLNVREAHLPPAYALLPGSSFIEFLPVDEDGASLPDVQPLLPQEVLIGELYEIVLTNAAGLYRYRMGDVVRVVGFYRQSPTFDFQFRRKQMLNVHMEKVSEASFTEALKEAVRLWPEHELVDFTTAESVLDPISQVGAPPHYLVILELNGPTEMSQGQLDDIDASLQRSHYVYKSFRVKNSIGAMRVVRVRQGTFLEFRQHVVATTQTASLQFKQSRVLRNSEQVNFFLERAV